MLQEAALLGEGRHFAGPRLEGVEFADGMAQERLVAPGPLELAFDLCPRLDRFAPGVPGVRHAGGHVGAVGIGVEQAAVRRAVEQAALLELALDLDQTVTEFAKHCNADRLVVYESPAAAIGAQAAA